MRCGAGHESADGQMFCGQCGERLTFVAHDARASAAPHADDPSEVLGSAVRAAGPGSPQNPLKKAWAQFKHGWDNADEINERIRKRKAAANPNPAPVARNASRIVPGIACPTCGQQRVERITAGKKAGAGLMFGVLAAGYASQTFKCQNCGYKW
jgi:uncharacterized Zn finger protein (UPF0148 family)